MRNLYDIILDICHVENGLAYGDIRFEYGKLACAMKPGHPADILDDLIRDIGDRLVSNPEAEIEPLELVELLGNLKQFKAAFKVKELAKPIKDLDGFLKADKVED